MTRGPAWVQALPELPYIRHTSYAGSDVFVTLTFLDSTQAPIEPTTISYRIDSLESAQNIVPTTAVTPTGTSQILQISGTVLQLTRQWYGRENMQVWVVATYIDSATGKTSTANTVIIIELIAIATAPQ